MNSAKESHVPKILIVDDDRLNHLLLTAILERDGHHTISAYDGPEGRRLASDEKPDLIVLDVMMPGENGFETCTLLKQEQETTDIPIIFISALDDVDSKVKGLTLGGVDYISKPFEAAEVLARTRIHLKLRHAYQAVINNQADKLKQIQEAQQSILIHPDDIPEAKFSVSYIPLQEAGGDFYDVFPLTDNIHGYFVGDISGHDLGASFVTPALKALLAQNARPIFTPVETMKMINGVLNLVIPPGMYLTACYAHLNRLRSTLTLVGAGHPPAIYLDGNGQVREIQASGDVLGAFENVVFDSVQVKVSPGDRLFLYTDGIIELFGKSTRGRDKGIDILSRACQDTRNLSLDESLAEMSKRLFGCNVPQEDDYLLLGIEV